MLYSNIGDLNLLFSAHDEYFTLEDAVGLNLFNEYTKMLETPLYFNADSNNNYGICLRSITNDRKKYVTLAITPLGIIQAYVYDATTNTAEGSIQLADLSQYV